MPRKNKTTFVTIRLQNQPQSIVTALSDAKPQSAAQNTDYL
jgi:hypothetical protein